MASVFHRLVLQHFFGDALALRRLNAASSHHCTWPRLWQSKTVTTHTHHVYLQPGLVLPWMRDLLWALIGGMPVLGFDA